MLKHAKQGAERARKLDHYGRRALQMNANLPKLQPYPFEKLTRLKLGIAPPPDKSSIVMSIGEPAHATPQFIVDALKENLAGLAHYPTILGSPELRQSIASWLTCRFRLKEGSLDIDRHILPVNGTREALFAFAQCVVDSSLDALVLMPNPFYQIYEGAALLAGAEPWYLNLNADGIPDFESVPDHIWTRCQLLYLCSPGNPSGAVCDLTVLKKLIALAHHYDFIIAADECYSEIYFDENKPPAGLLEAAAAFDLDDYSRCVVFHSLSKRSNVPGLRSGFIAGDAKIIDKFRLFRTYHGCAMPLPTQAASLKAWQDEEHVIANRHLYKEKFKAVLEILRPAMEVKMPSASFYLWLAVADDEQFSHALFKTQNVTVLPGSYLSRETDGTNPGFGRVRIALVPSLEDCIDAAFRIRELIT